jgi:hypothetical protein
VPWQQRQQRWQRLWQQRQLGKQWQQQGPVLLLLLLLQEA